MVVSSTNENKSQIIKTYYIINIITNTYYKSFWKVWILFCGYKSFDVYNSILIQIQFIIMKFKVYKKHVKSFELWASYQVKMKKNHKSSKHIAQ
jgi:hypothetical protein